MDFNALHQQNQPLLLANVWDASSAQAAQQAGYQALGSSSAAIAAMLGYEDGEEMSFDELFYVVSRIKTVSELPLSVDLEAGYGATTSHIIDNIPVCLLMSAPIPFFSTYKMRWFRRSIAVNSTPNTAHAVFLCLASPARRILSPSFTTCLYP